MDIIRLYNKLLKQFGQQGWWPLLEFKDENYSVKMYHPKDYSYPKNNRQRFEICVGAILTQNTSWLNVEKVLHSLKDHNALSPLKILRLKNVKLEELIRPAGYYRQKALKLRKFADFFIDVNGSIPTREQLLGVWGIGPETADSMLCYAFNEPVFIVDAYTKRLFLREGFLDETDSKTQTYEYIQHLVHDAGEKTFKDKFETLIFYQEFHALIVENEKNFQERKSKK